MFKQSETALFNILQTILDALKEVRIELRKYLDEPAVDIVLVSLNGSHIPLDEVGVKFGLMAGDIIAKAVNPNSGWEKPVTLLALRLDNDGFGEANTPYGNHTGLRDAVLKQCYEFDSLRALAARAFNVAYVERKMDVTLQNLSTGGASELTKEEFARVWFK